MGYHSSFARAFLRLMVVGALLAPCLVPLGCGSDSGAEPSGAEKARQEREAVREAREEQENQAAKQELESGDYVSCGGQVFVSKRSLCTYARNVQNAYYTEVQVGQGKTLGYEPHAEQDYRVLCSGSIPHKCTGFKDDGGGIEPLKSGVIFFSP
jgi:hypothetical protein